MGPCSLNPISLSLLAELISRGLPSPMFTLGNIESRVCLVCPLRDFLVQLKLGQAFCGYRFITGLLVPDGEPGGTAQPHVNLQTMRVKISGGWNSQLHCSWQEKTLAVGCSSYTVGDRTHLLPRGACSSKFDVTRCEVTWAKSRHTPR